MFDGAARKKTNPMQESASCHGDATKPPAIGDGHTEICNAWQRKTHKVVMNGNKKHAFVMNGKTINMFVIKQ